MSSLRGRRAECRRLDQVLEQLRAGSSAVLVVRGEAGIGKTALLSYLAEQASGHRVLRAAGVESEMELVFAGVHHLCAPLLHERAALPDPQRTALETAFGLRDGDSPDRFLVALAVLSLIAQAADTQPLVCLV